MTTSPDSPTTPTRPDQRGLTQVVRRLGWGVADQGISSLSNFALGLFVANSFGASSFGAFALAFVTYTVVINAARGLATDPLLVRHSGPMSERWRQATSSAAGTALAVGAVAGALCILAGLLLPPPVGLGFIVLGVGLPGLALQDSWRFAFFACGRGSSAFINDLFWTALLVVALVLIHQQGDGSAELCLLAFGGTATLAAVLGGIQAGTLPRPLQARQWLRTHSTLAVRYLIENVSISGAAQIRSFVLGGVAGLAAVGHVRASEILMGPFYVVLMGISQVAVPEASRVFHRNPGRLRRFCFRLGAVQAAAAIAWGLLILTVFPLGPGPALLPDLWIPTVQLIPAITLTVAATSMITAAAAGLRAMGLARQSLRAQLTGSGAYLVGGTVGAVLGGAVGASWGVTVAQCFSALVWWHYLRSSLDRAAVEGAGEQMGVTSVAPRLTLGLPVYNGERFLAESLDALLAQSFTDFELIISDNGSTDGTGEIAERYAAQDSRIRYVRHPSNLGATFNHNFVIEQARGEFFKWVSDDDLYAPNLLQECIDALDARPEIALAHAWTAYINDQSVVTHRPDYPLVTDVGDPVERFRSLLYTNGGDDIYGVIRMSVLRQVAPFDSYHMSDRTFVADLALHGPFHNVPEYLYFRRDHPKRVSRAAGQIRRRCSHLDPARANRWRHPVVRLLGEYVLGYVSAIRRAPMSRKDRSRCGRSLAVWVLRHASPAHRRRLLERHYPTSPAIDPSSPAARLTYTVSAGLERVDFAERREGNTW